MLIGVISVVRLVSGRLSAATKTDFQREAQRHEWQVEERREKQLLIEHKDGQPRSAGSSSPLYLLGIPLLAWSFFSEDVTSNDHMGNALLSVFGWGAVGPATLIPHRRRDLEADVIIGPLIFGAAGLGLLAVGYSLIQIARDVLVATAGAAIVEKGRGEQRADDLEEDARRKDADQVRREAESGDTVVGMTSYEAIQHKLLCPDAHGLRRYLQR